MPASRSHFPEEGVEGPSTGCVHDTHLVGRAGSANGGGDALSHLTVRKSDSLSRHTRFRGFSGAPNSSAEFPTPCTSGSGRVWTERL